MTFSELHPVHTSVNIWSSDVDGEPIYICVWLFQRWYHCGSLQTILYTKGARGWGKLYSSTNSPFLFWWIIPYISIQQFGIVHCVLKALKRQSWPQQTTNLATCFLVFDKNKVYFMRIVCQQTILMKDHALFVIFEKAAKFEIVVCCKL